MPFSGWTGRQPIARSIPAPAVPTTKPKPPLRTRLAKIAMVASALPDRTGPASGPASAAVSARSASRNSRCLGPLPGTSGGIAPASIRATASAPDRMASALPRLRGCLMTLAPAAAARRPVSSSDPSSATITRSAPSSLVAAVTVAVMRSASFLAGMMTARSPGGMAEILMLARLAAGRSQSAGLLAGGADRLVQHGENRLQASHLQHLASCRAGAGELKLTAALTRGPVRREQDVDAGGVTEVDSGHVHDQPGRARAQRRRQF